VTATPAVTNGPSGRERGAESNGLEGSNRARWEAAGWSYRALGRRNSA